MMRVVVRQIMKIIVMIIPVILMSQCTLMTIATGNTTTEKTTEAYTDSNYDDKVTYTSEASSVGMNVWFVNDWDGSNAFVNLIKHGRPWSQTGVFDQLVPVDSNYLPATDFSTVLFAGQNVTKTLDRDNSSEIDNKIIIHITDNGVGMKKDDLEKLFRIDMTFHKKGTNNESGTGLGLILCKEFAELNDGKLTVISEENKGSTFSIELEKMES